MTNNAFHHLHKLHINYKIIIVTKDKDWQHLNDWMTFENVEPQQEMHTNPSMLLSFMLLELLKIFMVCFTPKKGLVLFLFQIFDVASLASISQWI